MYIGKLAIDRFNIKLHEIYAKILCDIVFQVGTVYKQK